MSILKIELTPEMRECLREEAKRRGQEEAERSTHGIIELEGSGKSAWAGADVSGKEVTRRVAIAAGTIVAVALALLLSGWATLADVPNGTPEFVYVTNQSLSSISQFRVGTDGNLLPLSPPTVSSGMGSLQSAVAVSHTGRFVYVANQNRDTISVFRAAEDGALTPLADFDVPTEEAPTAITFHPAGKFVYVVCQQSISQYQVAANGHLKALSPAAAVCPFLTKRLAVDTQGRFAYAAGVGGVQSYKVLASGLLSPLSTNIASGQSPADVVISPQGFVYVPCLNGLYQYEESASGELTPLPSPSVPAEKLPVAAVMDTSSRRVYVISHVNNGSGTVAQYAAGADGGLTRTADPLLMTGNAPVKAGLDPSGRFLYVASAGDASVTRFRVAADGSLAPLGATPHISAGALALTQHLPGFSPALFKTRERLPSGPPRLSDTERRVLSQHPEFVYVANGPSDSISEYAVQADGTLKTLGMQNTGSSPDSIALDPKGRFAYVSCAGHQQIWQYRILSDGRFSSLIPSFVPSGTLPSSITITPDAKFVYVTNYVDGTISQFRVGSDGTLSPLGTPVKTETQPKVITTDPAGHFVYVCCNRSDNEVTRFRIGTDGSLAAVTPSLNIGHGSAGMPIFSSGGFSYISSTNQTLHSYHVAADGTLTALSPEPLGLAATATNLAVVPTGKFAYATHEFKNSLSSYRIESDGLFSPLPFSDTPTGAHPGPLTADPSGHFLYVLNEDDHTITQYRIMSDGRLVALAPTQVPTGFLTYLADPHTIAVFQR